MHLGQKLSQMELYDICGHQIDIDGKEPETILSNRLISIPLNSLAQIPMVMGLCAGNDKNTFHHLRYPRRISEWSDH